jgi:hypothetical protein
MNPDDIAHLTELIEAHKRRLHIRELQAAKFGISCPPEILTEIDDIKGQIEQAQQQIGDGTVQSLVAGAGMLEQIGQRLADVEQRLQNVTLNERVKIRFLGISIYEYTRVISLMVQLFPVVIGTGVISILLGVATLSGQASPSPGAVPTVLATATALPAATITPNPTTTPTAVPNGASDLPTAAPLLQPTRPVTPSAGAQTPPPASTPCPSASPLPGSGLPCGEPAAGANGERSASWLPLAIGAALVLIGALVILVPLLAVLMGKRERSRQQV